MKCKNCQLEYNPRRKTSFFCSNKCRAFFNRKLANGELANANAKISERAVSERNEQTNTEQLRTGNAENSRGEDVREMDAQMLYTCIGSYPQDTWKDSPEYLELLKRLKKPVKWLTENGYFVPSRLMS